MAVNMQAVVWMALLVVLLIVEAVTLGLATIWFAGGALAAFVLALAGTDTLLQIAVFCIVSIVLLLATRPAAVRWLNKDRTKTNAQSLLGDTAVVTEAIDNVANSGQVQVRGQYWTARTDRDQETIPEGKRVVIQRISGVKLIVREE